MFNTVRPGAGSKPWPILRMNRTPAGPGKGRCGGEATQIASIPRLVPIIPANPWQGFLSGPAFRSIREAGPTLLNPDHHAMNRFPVAALGEPYRRFNSRWWRLQALQPAPLTMFNNRPVAIHMTKVYLIKTIQKIIFSYFL